MSQKQSINSCLSSAASLTQVVRTLLLSTPLAGILVVIRLMSARIMWIVGQPTFCERRQAHGLHSGVSD